MLHIVQKKKTGEFYAAKIVSELLIHIYLLINNFCIKNGNALFI